MTAIQTRAFARATHDVRSELKLAFEPSATFAEPQRTERAPAFIRYLPERVDDLFVSDAILEPYAALAFNLAGSFEDELLARGRQLVQERLAGPNVDLNELTAEISALFEDRFSDARLENIARTEFSKAYNTGRNDLMLSPDVADLVVGMQYSSVVDSRTTDYCDAWDGIVIAREDTASIAKYGPPAHFQAVATGTMIETDRGSRPIESIDVGDRVKTHEGRYRRVYATMGKPSDGMIRRVETQSGRVLFVTHEHPILTSVLGWKRADKVCVGDYVFEDAEQMTEPHGARSTCDQSVLLDAHNNPAFLDEPSVAWKILRLSPSGVPASIKLKIDSHRSNNEREVENVADSRVLERKLDSSSREGRENYGFMPRRVGSERVGLCGRHFISDSRHPRGVNRGHALGVLPIDSGRVFSESESPMVNAPGVVGGIRTEQRGALSLGSRFDSEPSTRSHENGLPDSDLSLKSAQGNSVAPVALLDEQPNGVNVSQVEHENLPRWGVSAIISIAEVEHKGYVWNLAVEEDETYIAAGIVVHNCRSMWVPVTTFDDIPATPREAWPSIQPMPGFGGTA